MTYRKLLLLPISIVFVVILSSQIIYAFDDGFFWEFANYAVDSGVAGTVYPSTNWFQISDSDLAANPTVNQLSVTVRSKTSGGTVIETLDLVLTETGGTTGLFRIGYIGGHDYRNDKNYGVIQAVDEFVSEMGLELELGENYTWFVRKWES